ncbi:MAG: hypothetical protein AAGD32_05295 [Planctomycetota bacterium]
MPTAVADLKLKSLPLTGLKCPTGKRSDRNHAAVPLGIGADRSFREKGRRHRTRMLKHANRAAELIGTLPGPDESIQVLIAATIDGWAWVDATIQLAGGIKTLYIATLGFNDRNADALITAIDNGKIGRVEMIASTYYAATPDSIYPQLAEALRSRGMRIAAPRNHAKILACKLPNGRTVTYHGSANLRSCRNVEQVAIEGSSRVFRFYRDYITDAIDAAGNA